MKEYGFDLNLDYQSFMWEEPDWAKFAFLFKVTDIVYTKKYPLRVYILGVLMHTAGTDTG